MQAQRTDNINVLGLAVDGDSSASTIKHRHKSGTWANRPSAGEAGRFYYCTDTGWTLMDDGALWHVISHNPKLSDHLRQDFHEPGVTGPLTANGWMFGWFFTEVTAGELDDGAGTGHSYAQLVAKTTSGASANLTPAGNNQPYIDPISSRCYPLICEMGLRLDDNANVTYHFGLVDSWSGAQAAQPNSSIMFGYGRSGDADALQFFAVTRDNGGGETTTDSGTTPTHSNIDICRIEVDSTSEARFYINGTLVATHAAGIPATETLHPAFGVRTNTNADKLLSVDYIDLYYKRYI
jgi:hypothetical protein